MPILGIGLHVLVAIFFAVHAIRSGQAMYWLIILFSFPLLGSVVYFFAIYLPASRIQSGAKKAMAVTMKILDPERELREARADFEATPTAQNQILLAQALLNMGEAHEAAQNYEACLKGPFASDANMRLGAAKAYVGCGRFSEALMHLENIRKDSPDFRKPEVSLALACAYAGAGEHQKASDLFESAYTEFGGFEIGAEYAIWAMKVGEIEKAQVLKSEIEKIMKRWPAHAKKLNAPIVRRLNAAFSQKI